MRITPLEEMPRADTTTGNSAIPILFTRSPALGQTLETKSSRAQDETIRECLPYLKGIDDPANDPFDYNEHGVLHLNREEHIDFLTSHLSDYPAGYVGYDASRPWIMYWGLMGLYLLGKDPTTYRAR
jgi:protein farnesyltransferase subunit beta